MKGVARDEGECCYPLLKELPGPISCRTCLVLERVVPFKLSRMTRFCNVTYQLS